jgi:Flp pilus assembly protein TadG
MRRPHCRGAAAIEAALAMAALGALMTLAIDAGQLAAGGSAVDRAASNAARYLASVPLESLSDSSRRAVVLSVAQEMIEETLGAASVEGLQTVEYRCGSRSCSEMDASETPAKVSVVVTIEYHEMFGEQALRVMTVEAEASRDN